MLRNFSHAQDTLADLLAAEVPQEVVAALRYDEAIVVNPFDRGYLGVQ